MEFLTGLLVVGGFFFWLFAAVFVILLTSTVHHERPGLGLTVVLAGLLAMQFMSDFKPFTWVAENPMLFGIGVAAYLGVAMLWAIFKWYQLSSKARHLYQTIRDKYVARLNRPFDVVIDKAPLATEVSKSLGYSGFKTIPPRPEQHSKSIVMWMVFWPIDFVWSLINEQSILLMMWIFSKIKGLLDHISKSRFKGFEELN